MYALQTGPGFTRRLRTLSFSPLYPRVLAFAEQYEPVTTVTAAVVRAPDPAIAVVVLPTVARSGRSHRPG